MKNITLSAPAEHIQAARHKATLKGTTLNNEFRAWLASQATLKDARANNYKQLMKRLRHINAGRKFTREEMNER